MRPNWMPSFFHNSRPNRGHYIRAKWQGQKAQPASGKKASLYLLHLSFLLAFLQLVLQLRRLASQFELGSQAKWARLLISHLTAAYSTHQRSKHHEDWAAEVIMNSGLMHWVPQVRMCKGFVPITKASLDVLLRAILRQVPASQTPL